MYLYAWSTDFVEMWSNFPGQIYHLYLRGDIPTKIPLRICIIDRAVEKLKPESGEFKA